MGLAEYGWSDMFLPLVNPDRIYDYDEVVPEIIDSVAILGEAYHAKMAEQFEGGLVDVYETPGKRSGAYNSAQFGVGSFVLLNYQGSLNDVFTVAHEMGHSMHSRLSQENQPYATHRYTIFVAEVAAILNEKLLLEHLLNSATGPRERIALLETQLKGIAGTFFLQTMMADYEIRAHALVEAGEGISAEILTDLWKAVVEDHFGDLIPMDDPYYHSWARIPHLFNSPFYVYQYATCYASAAAIMQQMRSDPERAIPRYLDLLKSGGSDYPMEQLRKAGVDLTDSSVVQSVVEEFSQLVDRLDSEYTRYRNLE
jgi:oligoendopeptidase F